MAKRKRRRKEKLESSGRRAFFQDLFVKAIETAEVVGKNMAERATPRFPYEPPAYPYDPSIYHDPYHDHDHHYHGDEPYGPPWPPPFGPSIPMDLQRKLREWHKTPPVDTVARGASGEDAHFPPD